MAMIAQAAAADQLVASQQAASHHASSSSFSSTFGIRLTFTQGFLAGQLSVVIIALLAIRFIIFEDARTAKPSSTARRQQSGLPLRASASASTKQRKGVTAQGTSGGTDGTRAAGKGGAEVDVARIMSDILAKVQYEMDSHASETIDWVNVVVAQALAGYRQDIMAGGWSATHGGDGSNGSTRGGRDTQQEEQTDTQRTAQDWMEEILNVNTVGRGMSFLDPIQVTHVEFGDSYPVFSNAKVRPADDMGRMRVEMDVDYTDCISLAIKTKLLINLPRPRFAVLPISLGLTIERFSGTLAIELFSTSPSSVLPSASRGQAAVAPRSRHELHFSLHPDFALDATATSLVGSRAKLQDLPKIEQLLVGRVRSFIHDRFVWPKFWSVTLPNLVPRHVRTSAQRREDEFALEGEGGMHLRGTGNALTDEERSNGLHDQQQRVRQQQQHDDVFFETPPPLFPGVFQHQQPQPHQQQADHTHPVPGALPTVEAWRYHAAASGPGGGGAGAGSTARPLSAAAGRSRPASSHAVTSSSIGNLNGVPQRRPELRQRTMNYEHGSADAPPSTAMSFDR